MVGLGHLHRDLFAISESSSTSADGSVVVGRSTVFGGEFRPFRWTQASGMVDLGQLPNTLNGDARAVSADGSVVVGNSGATAFIWTAEDGMRSLETLLTNEAGIDLTGWSLFSASGISADGLTITGWGINPSGFTEAWIATLSGGGCDCPADVNIDGLTDGGDIQGFVDCLLATGANCECADLDGTPGLDLDDVAPFVAAMLSGTGCP